MDHSVISAMEHNMREKLKYVASRSRVMETLTLKEVSMVNSHYPSDTFNTAFGGSIDQASAEAVFSYYKDLNLPMAWWLGPSSAAMGTTELLVQAGFEHDEVDIGMVCDLSLVPESLDERSELAIRTVESTNHFVEFSSVLASIFDPPDLYVKAFYQEMASIAQQDRPEMLLFVAYEGTEPVASSCLFLTDLAGIYDIATRPDKRQRGYGSLVFYRALLEAKKRGFQTGVLQASADGLNIYKRFGFVEVCEFNVWSNRAAVFEVPS